MAWRDAARGRTAECEMNPKGFLGRSMDFCLRIESGACERTPSGRGPREWSRRKSSSRFGCVPSGGFLADPCLLAARWHEFLPIQTQRSDTEVRAPEWGWGHPPRRLESHGDRLIPRRRQQPTKELRNGCSREPHALPPRAGRFRAVPQPEGAWPRPDSVFPPHAASATSRRGGREW